MDWDGIFEELLFLDKKGFRKQLYDTMSQNHAFIHIRLDKYKVYLGWDELK